MKYFLLIILLLASTSTVYADTDILIGKDDSLINHDPLSFETIDAHALAAPSSLKSSVAELAAYLVEPAKSDVEKVRSIFRWMADNIAYDTRAFFSGSYGSLDSASVLRSGKSVCSGYSNLFKALCEEAGIEVVSISGYSKGYGYRQGATFNNTNHEWNAVKLNGAWYLLDSTWGAGSVNGRVFKKKLKEFWFLTDPEKFIYTHLPVNDSWQLLENVISMSQYKKTPALRSYFWDLGFDGNEIDAYVNSTEYRGLPKTYSVDAPVQLIEAPVYKYLSKDQEYTITVKIDGALSVALINNREWMYLEKEDGSWTITLTPKRGALSLNYSLKGRYESHSTIMEYRVE